MSDKTWIQTSQGAAFDFAHIDPDAINPLDIAAGLSKECRYTGQCPYFYSVAQHCYYAREYIVNQYNVKPWHPLAQAALLHDGSEAYCKDLSSPLKAMMRHIMENMYGPHVLDPYDLIERDLHEAIRKRFGITKEMFYDPRVKEADRRVYATERLALFPDETKRPWKPEGEPIPWISVNRWWDRSRGEVFAAHERYIWALQDANLLGR